MNRSICVLLALGAAATPVAAQTMWRYSAGVAGATMGGALVYMIEGASAVSCIMNADPNCGHIDQAAKLSVVGGLGLLGFIQGHDVDRAIARGETIPRGTRNRLRAQLVVTGILLPPMLLSRVEHEPSRQQLSWIGAVAGAVAGFHLQERFGPTLIPKPKIGVTPARDGVRLQVSTPW